MIDAANDDESDNVIQLGTATYTHEALIDLIIKNPGWSHKRYAAHFGRNMAWFCSILALDSFQDSLDPRRHEIHDPTITATMDERMRGLALSSMATLQKHLDNPKMDTFNVVKTMEIATKALGMGVPNARGAPQRLPAIGTHLGNKAAELVQNMRNTGAGRLSADSAITDVEIIDRD